MGFVTRTGESIARLTDRRQFLRSGALTLFGLAAASALELGRPTSALAATCQSTSSYCNCNPPNGTYCAGSNCSGADCSGSCSFRYSPYSQTACWCTLDCCYNGGHLSGYYVCCDCNCPSGACGCHSFVTTCTASPSGPAPANRQVIGPRGQGKDTPNWTPCC
jgi:hypothetical protein